jgi:hypothetical protein
MSDVFREYRWNGPWKTIDCPYVNWQRVTDPGTNHDGAKKYLPNPVNTVAIDDLRDALRAECCIEQWGGHAGTSDKKIRINGHGWIEIPESPYMGSERPESYQYMRYPVVDVPLDQLRQGNNEFELSCSNQVSHLIHGIGWGQWGIYGVIFRIYYGPGKPHPGGRLGPHVWKDDRFLSIALEPDDSATSDRIDRIEFLGLYEDFDHNGDGRYRQWHYRYRHGRLVDHLGTSCTHPFQITVDTEWIPDQDQPLKIAALITDYAGITRRSAEAEIPWPARRAMCRMYKPRNVPACWQSRDGQRHSCSIDIPDNLKRAVEARLVVASWNGYEADGLGINGRQLVQRIGRNHDFALNELGIPPSVLRQGDNEIYTYGSTPHHGIEVLWPGPVIKVRYGA